MRLIKEFQSRVDRFTVCKRLIERAKTMVDVHKIALVGEFRDVAARPLLSIDTSPFARAYQRRADDHANILKLWISSEAIETFPVPARLLPENCPQYSYANLFGRDHRDLDRIAGYMHRTGMVTGDYASNALANHERWLRRAETYPAVHLGQILMAMEWKLQTDLEPREWSALLQDDGGIVAGFWNNVNKLADYSGHFPNRPKFRAGPKDPGREKRASAAAPAFGWAQPASI